MSPEIYERFATKYLVEPNSGCWLWTAYCMPSGYGQLKAGKGMKYAHRLSYEHFKGTIPEDLEIDHLCRTRCCVNPDHLEAVPHAVNMSRGVPVSGDSHWLRLTPERYEGTNNPQVKLNETLVKQIRADVAAGKTQRAVAKSLGISNQHVSDIVSRKYWSHID